MYCNPMLLSYAIAFFVIAEIPIYKKTPRLPLGVLDNKDIPRADIMMQHATFASIHMGWNSSGGASHKNTSR